ncbi:MAG: 23S rRNA (adenine(2503)-C(2))-methyltransferase RlmN [Alphaproteobacteria bacterium]|nr:23S rRNA (adenine(2503)-C(2))-methyltransferase RlmN [Alphaproteobacteria bacterium]
MSTSTASDARQPLVGLGRAELSALFAEMGEPKFRAKQVWSWLYAHGVTDFEAMTNLSKPFRARLQDRFTLARPDIVTELASTDGTIKWLLRLPDGNEVEMVFIPEEDRGTLCVSSQVGCTLTCKFCHTGTQRLVRNLGPYEILGQVMLARDRLGEWGRKEEKRRLTNIVMMGMGEPLYNFENVRDALLVAMDGDGIGFSKRKVTLSTAGVVPMMERAGDEIGCSLAVSLHATTDEVRNEIVPLNKKYPIAELLDACRRYPGVHNARRITFEYVMLDGVNDSDADARRLARLLKDIPSKVNLIPFNPWPGSAYVRSPDERILKFQDIVANEGLMPAPIRRPRGEDIMAACGQLKSASQKLKRADRDRLAAEASAA